MQDYNSLASADEVSEVIKGKKLQGASRPEGTREELKGILTWSPIYPDEGKLNPAEKER